MTDAAREAGDVETEKFSGLKLKGRKVSAKRWDELMIGKRFVNFNALQNLGDSNKPAVAIGVLYEKGFAKTSNTGSQYVHWSFTDFCTPQPRLLKLLLCSEAFEAWHVDLGKTVHYGAAFAMLNPTASNQRPDQGSETLISAKVTHSTQLVLLGQFPSLGFCSCHKKDGLPCSMPCDTEKTGGRLVCFYHTMHQEAQKIRNFAEMKKSQGTRGADVTPGLVVRPGPTPKAKGASKGASQKMDASMARLLRGASPRKEASQPKVKKEEKSSQKPSQRVATPCRVAPTPTPARSSTAPVQATQSTQATSTASKAPASRPSTPSPTEDEAPVSEVERKLRAMFPNGLPSVDPNRPLQSQRRLQEAMGSAKGAVSAAAVVGLKELRPGEVPKAALSRRSSPLEAQRETKSGAVSFKKLESDFGRKAASMLAAAVDPRKDLVRQQRSRFESAAELEHSAKRMRRLNELEQMDAAQEQMEELKKMKVRAYRCKTCYTTFDSERQRLRCQEEGHVVVQVEATKTRWECASCKFSEEVLDRQLPGCCRRCRGETWKQVPLRKLRRSAPMEKDMLLPRGEELPFLNSIPEMAGRRGWQKEAVDDYEGL